MSASDDEEVPGREVAHRLFAAEYDDASLSYAESDEERAPNYVVSPTGARVNRLFAVGTLTEVSPVNDEMLRARVVDPTGAFVVYAGQYQPDELAALEQLEPPAFVAVTGKARTFQPEDADQVYTSIRPESIATVDAETRDRWVVSAAEQTIERIGIYAGAAELDASGEQLTDALADAGVENGFAAGIPLAQDHYGTTPAYLAALRDCAREAVEVVADEREQVSGLDVRPGDASAEYDAATFGSLAALTDIEFADREPDSAADEEPPQRTEGATATAGQDASTSVEAGASDSVGTSSVAGTATSSDRGSGSGSEAEPESVPSIDRESGSAPASEGVSGSTASPGDPSETEADVGSELDAESSEADVDAAESEADDGLGDFDAGDGSEMYEMDEEEREQIESEYGTEFTTGAEVDEPGEADIDVPEPDDASTDDQGRDGDGSTDEPESDELGAPPESGLDVEAATDAEPESDEDATATADEDESALEDESDADRTADEPVAADGQDVEDEAQSVETDVDSSADADEESGAPDVDVQTRVIETMEAMDDGDGADRSELVETVAADTGVPEADIEDAIQDALMGGQCYEPDDETLKAI